ncbi:MAG: SLC13 family permease [Gammaproteobacteria bacterium]
MPAPVVTLLGVLLLIAVREVGPVRIAIWQGMAAGAVVVLAGGWISLPAAAHAIDWQVMLFLFGVFLIGHALETSGWLAMLAHRLFRGARSTHGLVWRLLVGAAAASALLMNDTLAIIATPVALGLARRHHIDPKLLLLTLAFAITIGSVASPVGNPQNLLIAIHSGLAAPFAAFASHLLLPTLVNLGVAYGVLRISFRREFHATRLVHTVQPVDDPALARLAGICVVLLAALIAAKAVTVRLLPAASPPLSALALAAATPLLAFSPRRLELVRGIDWRTLVFFAALFVLMGAVWDTGFIQAQLARLGLDPTWPPAVLAVSALVSQLISNVPMVALYLPVLAHHQASVPALMALAAGSTIAGNLLLLGAASNIIIVQQAERRAGVLVSFVEFARLGIPLTALNLGVYWLAMHWHL